MTVKATFLRIFIFMITVFSGIYQPGTAQPVDDPGNNAPYIESGSPVYADIDTTNQVVFILLTNQLWEYDLNTTEWTFLSTLDPLPKYISKFDFGYDGKHHRLLLWSRGAGEVYQIDLTSFNTTRIDRSFNHKNQNGLAPFFHNGELYAFGGYGFWEWHNLITFFNNDIKEWNVVTVAKSSPIPKERVAFTGFYKTSTQEYYLYGGSTYKSFNLDDKNVEKIQLNDFWKFNFATSTWKSLGVLKDENSYFFVSPSLQMIGSTNLISRSVYSNNSGFWYLPVSKNYYTNNTFYLKPVHTDPFEQYPSFQIPLGKSKDFLISNYLFNQKNHDLVLVGINLLTNSEKKSLRIEVIPEDSLLALMDGNENSDYVITAGLAGLAIILIILIYASAKTFAANSKKQRDYTLKDLQAFVWLTADEFNMLNLLWNVQGDTDSNLLEEKLWPTIDNFDYRRRLRNDILNSVNDKFRKHLNVDEDVILRKKDPTDNRRLRYSLNPDILDLDSEND